MRSRIGLTCVFQSTFPLRGATSKGETAATALIFQSTLPLQGATVLVAGIHVAVTISIHAPLAGSDSRNPARYQRNPYFNPRSPCRERHALSFLPSMMVTFQSTLPLRGATPG